MSKNMKNTVLTASIMALCAGMAIGSPTPDQPKAQSTNAADSVARSHIEQVQSIVRSSLNLEPGDEALIEQAVANPMSFVAIEKEREFTGQLIVHAKEHAQPITKQRASRRVSALTVKKSAFVEEYVVDVPDGMSEGELAAVLMATGDYEFVEPNWLRYPALLPNDSQFGSSWQHTRLQSTSAWDLNTGSSNIIVAVCDSGVDTDHPDLAGSLVSGYNSASNRTQANGGDVEDINGHGTFVSGCAAAIGNNGTGVVGVGWNYSIMPVRVTNNSNGTASGFDILEGVRWAAENGASVVNASFSGGTAGSNNAAGAYIKTLGSLLFWAAGNDGAFITPNRPDIVIVGSTTSSDTKSGFSNFGPAVDVTAPGSSVRSTRRGGSYGNGSGTSYASPIAMGVGAMIYSVNPDFNGDDVQQILYNSVDDLGAPGRDDNFGRGRVNTRKAIELAQVYIRPLLAPIAESFESSSWTDLLSAVSGSIQTVASTEAPDGSIVLELNDSDIAETVPLAGRSVDLPILSFSLMGNSIEGGDTLDIQYLEDPEVSPNTWTTIATITGQGAVGGSFVRYDLSLPAGYQWHGTKLRFDANGSDSSDTWLMDSLSIDTLGDPTAPLDDGFESGVLSAVRWDDVQGASVVFDSGTYAVEMTDADVIESRDIPLDQFGIVPAYIRFDAWSDGSVLPSDQLLVEVFNISNQWVPAGTVLGSDLGSGSSLIELDVPVTAIAIPNMRVRLTSTTAGSIFVDNMYVGVDELVAGCNAADLAEPFGELNFFDVSAFLAAFSSSSPDADLNGDGAFNFFDISQYLSTFNAGCP
ncbi:MAG: S8 family serine peptidase [Phycisphaerales bacterium]